MLCSCFVPTQVHSLVFLKVVEEKGKTVREPVIHRTVMDSPAVNMSAVR